MSRTVNIAVIGCGVIGKTHARALSALANATLTAVTDLRREEAAAIASELGVPKVHADAAALLADEDIEAVILALPACARTDLCLAAFAHGKHVLNEKPISMNPSETERMIAAAGDRVAACCSSRLRLMPSAKAAAEFIRSGALGELRVIRARELVPATPPPTKPPPVWRYSMGMNAGGIMSNWGCYDLDTILGMLDWSLKPERVLARTWTIPPGLADRIAPGSDAETHVAAVITFEGGVAMTFERGEQVARAPESAWEITGTTGTLYLRIRPDADKQLLFDRVTSAEGMTREVIWQGSEDWKMVHRAVVGDFVDAIADERPPATSFAQAAVVQKITHAIYDSSRLGREVVM